MKTVLIPILMLLSLSCTSSRPPIRAADARPVGHLVICWLKEPGHPAHRQRVIEASQELRRIPGVISVEAGEMLPSERPVVDSSYDIALYIVFSDEQALRAYDSHPIHRQLVEQVVKPLVGRYVVYDYVIETAHGP